MTFKNKYKLIKSFSNIFTVKTGEILKSDDGVCYRVNGIFAIFYKIYLFLMCSELGLILIVLASFYIDTFVGIWWLDVIIAILIYIAIELAFVALVPLDKVKCWEKDLQDIKAKDK